MPHLAPPYYQKKYDFTSIDLKGDFVYCESHNFVFNPEVEEEKLYNAQPCIYTDTRYKYYDCNSWLYFSRKRPLSLKSCIRRTLKCRNIPKGTIVYFGKDYYLPNKNVDFRFEFKVKKENNFKPKYQINEPSFFNLFENGSNELVNRLRKEGFLVQVWNSNPGFIYGDNEGEIAIAYGFGKIIGFSTGNDSFRGYQNGCKNTLWDKFGQFDKWSRCNEIPKDASIDEIINKLK